MDKIRCELWICTVALPFQRSAIYATPVIPPRMKVIIYLYVVIPLQFSRRETQNSPKSIATALH